MKPTILISALATAILLTGCKPPVANINGQWDWVCCEGKYQGDLELKQDASNKISGTMHGANDPTEGRIEGSITGNSVQFTRMWGDDFRQEYKLTLSADGKKLAGDLDGTHDESFGTHFEASRK